MTQPQKDTHSMISLTGGLQGGNKCIDKEQIGGWLPEAGVEGWGA